MKPDPKDPTPPASSPAAPAAPAAPDPAVAAAPAAIVAPPIEGLTLATSLPDLTADLDRRGWKHNARPPTAADQRVVVFPTAGAKRLELIVESSAVVGITATYDVGNPALREPFKALELQGDQPDGWYAGDKAHQLLAFVSKDDKQVRLLAAGRLRDQREVARMFQTFLKDPP